MSDSLNSLVHSETSLYALLEPKGPLRVRWGEPAGSPGESLTFRKFHFPRKKTPSAWGHFPFAATWALAEARDFRHHEVTEIPPLPRPASAEECARDAWNTLCLRAEAMIREERAQKLVPAREISFPISEHEYRVLLEGVASRLFFPQMENAYRFLVKSGRSVFFGATPELLFRREGGLLHVPAIAGTRALTPGVPESDLRADLLASEKDRAEHEWVVDGIRDSLRGLGLEPTFPKEPAVMRVPRLLHLYTPVQAKDNRALTADRLLEALHPTPAIGGLPRGVAQDFLFENEPTDRGLFSAPLLFRLPDREFCLVAIRSALLAPDRITFFAGAGYVRGSTPEAEWQETRRKLQVMQTVLFGGEP